MWRYVLVHHHVIYLIRLRCLSDCVFALFVFALDFPLCAVLFMPMKYKMQCMQQSESKQHTNIVYSYGSGTKKRVDETQNDSSSKSTGKKQTYTKF